VRVSASAPGKLVLVGEYAVLTGAPAIVMAADRRARVQVARANGRADGRESIVHARGGVAGAARYLFAGGRVTRSGETLPLVDAILNELVSELELDDAAPFAVELDTSAFFAASGTAGAHKLGLGSSAALTVAFASALAEYTGRPRRQEQRWISRLISAHRHFQSGRGSGLDIAASLSGGVISYRMNGADESPTIVARPLPDTFVTMAIWSGHAASTGVALERLERWRAQAPATHARVLAELGELASAADEAARVRDAATLLTVVDSYADALRRFGDASGIEIYGVGHARIAALARERGVVYKPCGAGGGDLGVACSTERVSLEELRAALESEGFSALDLAIDPVGLQVQASVE
jgi:phosphomevalonate kinase